MTNFCFVLALALMFSSVTCEQILSRDEALTEQKVRSVLERLGASEQKWQQLMETQDMKIHLMREKIEDQYHLLSRVQAEIVTPKAERGRTCAEILQLDPSSPSGNYTIDPDGPSGPGESFIVFCNMTTGETMVSHNAEAPTQITSCPSAGCYTKEIDYGVDVSQLKILSQLSLSCRQFIRFNCLGIPFEFNNIRYAWWNDVDGGVQRFWTGTKDLLPAQEHFCGCAVQEGGNECVDTSVFCNCDSLAFDPQSDEGEVTDKSLLPFTKLNFGRSNAVSTLGVHTLGKYICSGRAQLNGTPESCADLWQIGYTQSGVYTLQVGDVLRFVNCDFTKLPGEDGQETEITCLAANTDVCPAKKFFE